VRTKRPELLGSGIFDTKWEVECLFLVPESHEWSEHFEMVISFECFERTSLGQYCFGGIMRWFVMEMGGKDEVNEIESSSPP
jgi:hypothetical protein